MSVEEKVMDIGIISIGALAHLGIIMNRSLIRPKIRKKFPKYDALSLQCEHVIHHITQTLALGVITKYLPGSLGKELENDIPINSALTSWIAGYLIDGIIPKKHQWGQITSNSIGATIGYFLLDKLHF